MDDEVIGGGWLVDPSAVAKLRLERVRLAWQREDWAETILEGEELLDEEPNNADCLALVGDALLASGDPEIAMQMLDQRAALGAADGWVLAGLALARFECGDFPGAAEAAREATLLEPDAAEAWSTLGLALTLLGRDAEALTPLVTAANLDPERFPLPRVVSAAEGAELLRAAASLLTDPIRAFWAPVTIIWRDMPDLASLKGHSPPLSPLLLLMYDGAPPPDDDDDVRPDALLVFLDNLGRTTSDSEAIERLAEALEAEAIDWLGHDGSDDDDDA